MPPEHPKAVEPSRTRIRRYLVVLLCFILPGLLIAGGEYYFSTYRPAQEIELFQDKYALENIVLPADAESFQKLLEEIENSQEYTVSQFERAATANSITRAFREKYPDEWIQTSFDAEYHKDGLSFRYPSSLQVTEQDGQQFRGFNSLMEEPVDYGQIVVSILNQSTKLEACMQVSDALGMGRPWDENLGRMLTPEEDVIADQRQSQEARAKWNMFFDSIRDGTVTSSTAYAADTYHCNFGGDSNLHAKPIKVGDKNAAVIYKARMWFTSLPCTYNAQILIPRDEENFYQIAFSYTFGEFKNECAGFSWGADPAIPTRFDITDAEDAALRAVIKNNQYPDGDRFKSLFDNMRVVDGIIATLEVE